MTEYVIKKIGHRWFAYADGLSIGACADETAAVKLITGDSAKYGAKKKPLNWRGSQLAGNKS